VNDGLLRVPILSNVVVQGPKRLLLTHVPILRVPAELLGVRSHQIHGLVMDGTISHVLIIMVVHCRLIYILSHHTLPLRKLT